MYQWTLWNFYWPKLDLLIWDGKSVISPSFQIVEIMLNNFCFVSYMRFQFFYLDFWDLRSLFFLFSINRCLSLFQNFWWFALRNWFPFIHAFCKNHNCILYNSFLLWDERHLVVLFQVKVVILIEDRVTRFGCCHMLWEYFQRQI